MKQSKVSIGLINPKSPKNVASVMRAAGNYRVDRVFYSGIRYGLAMQRNPVTVDMSRKVSKDIPLSRVDNLIDKAFDDMKIVCIEFAENAISLPLYQHPHDVLYIFGPEDSSISQDLIDRADDVVYVPTVGCMNLAASVNVVLYDRLAKSATLSELDDNELIRKNRDINNSLIVNNE